MSLHRAINAALIALIVFLMAYLGPRLDEGCLLIGCGFVRLFEQDEPISTREVWLLRAVLGFMVFCTIAVTAGCIGYVLYRFGWI